MAMANRAAEAADASFRMKQEHLDEKEKLLRSYRQEVPQGSWPRRMPSMMGRNSNRGMGLGK